MQKLRNLFARVTTFRRVVIVLYQHRRTTDVTAPVQIRRVDPSNVQDVLHMEGNERLAEFQGFLDRGDHGYYAYRGDSVVHRAWVRFGPLRIPTWHSYGEIDLKRQDAYIHYCETAASARGLGVYPAVLARIAADLQASSTKRILISTELDNAASRRGIEKAGFEEWQHVTIQVTLGIGRAQMTPVGQLRGE